MMSDDERAMARTRLLAGASVNRAAKEAQISWSDANKVRLELIEAGELEPPAPKTPPEAADEEPPSEDALWDVSLQIPADRADDILATFTTKEKMDAIGAVLQQRMNVILEPAE